MKMAVWHLGSMGNACQRGPAFHRAHHPLKSCWSSITSLGGPCTHRVGWCPVLHPALLVPSWPGSDRPVAGWLGAVILGSRAQHLGYIYFVKLHAI